MQEPSSTSNFKYLLQGAFVVAVSLLLFVLAGDAYEKAAKRNQINAFTKQRFEEYYALEKNTVDLLFIGSSHSYCTFDPQLIDPVLGTYSWQLGTPSQHADTSYYVLQNALETQSPHTVVMEPHETQHRGNLSRLPARNGCGQWRGILPGPGLCLLRHYTAPGRV